MSPPAKPTSKWHWFGREAVLDEDRSAISFTDILFGLVLGVILGRGNDLGDMSWAGRMHLVVAAVLASASWIGYHNSRKKPRYQSRFFNLPLFSFVLDLSMVSLYWLVATNPEGVPELKNLPAHAPSAKLEATAVVLVFGLYVLWDLVALAMDAGDKYPETHHNAKRSWVTFAAFCAVALIAALVWSKDPGTNATVVAFDAAIVTVLVVYRWLKDGFYEDKQSPAQPPPAAPK